MTLIRVLNVISDTNIGGAGLSLLNYIKNRGPDFEVCAALPRESMLTPRLAELGVRCYETNGISDQSLDLSAVRELKKIIRDYDPDIVHTHGAMAGRIAARLCRKAVVFTRHSAFPLSPRLTSGPGKLVYGALSNTLADRAIAVSPVCRDDLISGGMDPLKIDVVLNGTDPLPVPDSERRAEARRLFGAENAGFIAGIPARIEPYKGHIYILEAVRALLDRGKDITVLIAGTGTAENAVRAKAEELGLGDHVRFLGFVSDTGSFYSALDLQLNASYIEATSMSLIEGMSMGLPAVVSSSGGNPAVIEDGVNGLVFPTRDSAALADRIEKIMDSDELRRTLSDGALDVFSRKFTGAAFARGVEDTYIKALEGRANGR